MSHLKHALNTKPVDMQAAIRRIHRTARIMHRQLPFIELEELESVGLVTLYDSLKKFDPERASFTTYLKRRLRWAMMTAATRRFPSYDAKRGLPLGVAQVSRRQRAQRVQMTSAHEQRFLPSLLESRWSSPPGTVTPVGDLSDGALDPSETPEQIASRAQTRRLLQAVLHELPKWERSVLTLHYFAGERFVTIARLLNMKKSRVSRLHRKALARCSELLGKRNLDLQLLLGTH